MTRKDDQDTARAMAVRAETMDWHLAELCRYYSLADVVAAWMAANGQQAATCTCERLQAAQAQLVALTEYNPPGGWLLDDDGNMRPEKSQA
jgi:hypothetical protein